MSTSKHPPQAPSTTAQAVKANDMLVALVRLLARQSAREILSPHLQKETHDVDGKV